ncbi:MAG: RES family NAD+ phosphorylase [Polyangiaceae bacterium]
MKLWRICRKQFAAKPLDGKGGMLAAGRWHTPRRLVTYASDSLALASLEVLVHCDLDLLPSDLLAVEIEVPTEVEVTELTTSDLPRSWRRYPVPRVLQELGNNWLDEATTAVLRVPSAIVPTECNYLINPLHSDVKAIRIVRRFRFAFDERLASENKPSSSALQRTKRKTSHR